MPEWLVLPTETQLINALLKSIPIMMCGLVIVFYCLREVRRSRKEDDVHKAEHKRKMADLAQQRIEWERAEEMLLGQSQAELHLKLDLSDEETLPDLISATKQAQPLVSALSQQEQSLGGLGFTLTEAKVKPGSVRLTLSPIERLGSAERVRRVAEELNTTASPLPLGVTAAHAVILKM
jgi:hypothetical protein